MEARGVAAMLGLLARRLDVACLLLRYTDRMPIESDESEEPAPASGDPEITRGALPEGAAVQ